LKHGLVTSFNRPGGNITGVTSMNVGLGAKPLELLHELLPTTAHFAVLVNPTNSNTEPTIAAARTAAVAFDRQIESSPPAAVANRGDLCRHVTKAHRRALCEP
jgi:putative ABC transport system substrate-binding protein